MSNPTVFTRDELQDIRSRSNVLADWNSSNNRDWKRAYESLAKAADHLDAMLARCEDREVTSNETG